MVGVLKFFFLQDTREVCQFGLRKKFSYFWFAKYFVNNIFFVYPRISLIV